MDLNNGVAEAVVATDLSRKRVVADDTSATDTHSKRLKTNNEAAETPIGEGENYSEEMPDAAVTTALQSPDEETLTKGTKSEPTTSAKKQRTKHIPLEKPPTDRNELLAALRGQIEYYFCDENMKRDAFFHNKISENPEGWLNMSYILSCRNIKRLEVQSEGILAEALSSSHLETKHADGVYWVRRVTPLPPLDTSLTRTRKAGYGPTLKTGEVHAAGCIVRAANVPEEAGWTKVKEAFKTILPPQTIIKFVTQVQQNGYCYVWILPFNEDQEFFSTTRNLNVGGCDVQVELVTEKSEAEHIISSIFPCPIARQRELALRKYQRTRKGPSTIEIGGVRFTSCVHLRKWLKELLQSKNPGDDLPSTDESYAVVCGVLQYHPRATQKMANMKGLKIDIAKQGEQKCFYIIYQDDTSDDFSIVQCMTELQKNPPILPVMKKREKLFSPKTSDDKDSCEVTADGNENGSDSSPVGSASIGTDGLVKMSANDKVENKIINNDYALE